MTKSTCLCHPENEPLVIIRQWQVAICEGNACAAALLSFFEYWHAIKRDMREKARYTNTVAARHGETDHYDETLIQFHTSEDLERGLMGLYKEDTIRKAVKYLEKRGFIEAVKNPNPRYAFDRTRHFQFCVDKVSSALDNYLLSSNQPERGYEKCDEEQKETQEENPTENRSPKSRVSYRKNLERSLKNPAQSPKNRGAIPEITPEISFESYSSASPPSTAPPIAVANTVSVDEWLSPEQIFRDLEYLHRVDPMFAELQLVEFRSWWRDKERFTPGEWDSKFLQRCVEQWDLRLIRQQELLKIDRKH